VSVKDSVVRVSIVPVSFSYNWPGGELVDRFGANSLVGGAYWFKTRSNWIVGLGGEYLFGNYVKESDILDPITSSGGFVIGENGAPSETDMFERGWVFMGRFGKLFSKLPFTNLDAGLNPNSGLLIMVGAGMLQHKIQIKSNALPLSEDLVKGYDRLSNGPAISEFLGYLFLSNNRLINFYFGLECIQGWTQNRRGYNYDTMREDIKKRMDIMTGIKVGWILPLYKKVPDEFYYY
jgi:hypothetical protein